MISVQNGGSDTSHYFTPDPKLHHSLTCIRYGIAGRELRLETDAGVFSRQRVDFGSDLLVRSLPRLTGRVLDLGCGYGPIGISLAVLNPEAEIVMTDINRRAVALARKNIGANKLENARAIESDGFESVQGTFAAIVSNPPIRAGKKLNYLLFEQSRSYLETGGGLWLVVQKKQGAPSTAAKLDAVFNNCATVAKEKGYWILCSKKI